MNFLNVFEQRVGSLFGATAQGMTAPFSFKKLARKAAREMESETFVIDGVDTAPALYTILVSSDDDLAMRPLYAKLTNETAQFIEGQAQNKGYVFVGKPVVRFMADPSLKSGKFSVFAENVDARTLTRLREEEAKFIGADSGPMSFGGAAAKPSRRPARPAAAAHPVASVAAAAPQAAMSPLSGPMSVSANPLSGTDAGLDVLPQEAVFDAEEAARLAAQRRMVPAPAAPAREHTGIPAAAPAAPIAPAAAPTPEVPVTVRAATPVPAPAPRPATCLLIDRQSGRTYTASAPRTTIGRERTPGGVVLHDPNVSRSHAELSFDGSAWHVRDLNSTNGTLVNDVDVDECMLHDGDLITLGLVTLEFRES